MKERSNYIVKITFINLVYFGRGVEKKKVETTKTFTVSAASPETAVKTATRRLAKHNAFNVSEILKVDVRNESLDQAIEMIRQRRAVIPCSINRKTPSSPSPSAGTLEQMRAIVKHDAAIDRTERLEAGHGCIH